MAGNSSLHFGRSAGANLPLNSSLRAIALSCHTSARAGGGARLTCCKVGLQRPLIPTAFVANWFRSARVSRPRRSANRRSPGDAPTVGDWESRGRRGAPGHRDGHDHSSSMTRAGHREANHGGYQSIPGDLEYLSPPPVRSQCGFVLVSSMKRRIEVAGIVQPFS